MQRDDGEVLGSPNAGDLPPAAAPTSTGPRPRTPAWAARLDPRRILHSRVVRHPIAPYVGLAVAVALFTGIVGGLWSARYWAFQTAAWDLGVYNQAMYTTVSGHALFYYTADLPAGTNGHLFAAHFAPFLILLLPFYAIAPDPSGLLVIQAAGLALGAVPVYFLARDKLGTGAWAALFAGVYLLSPLTIGSGWYDFHPEAFLPVTGLTAILFYERQRLYPFLAAWVLCLAVIETIAPFLLLLAAVGLVGLLWQRRQLARPDLFAGLRLNGLALATAAAWLAVAAAVIYSLNPTGGTFGAGYGGGWSTLGASSIFDVYPRAALDPAAAVAALASNDGYKALFVLIVFGGLAFLPLFGRRRYLLPALAWLGLALLSNHSGYYLLNDQYLDYMIPFLFPAAITGAVRWRGLRLPRPRLPIRGVAIAGVLVAGVVITSGLSSPLLDRPLASFNAVPHGVPIETEQDDVLHEVASLIPAKASVLTTSFIFPEVSDRPDAYVLPVSSLFVGGRTFDGVVAQYVNESQYVLVDFEVDFGGAALLTARANLSGFGLEAADQGAYLYERGWTGPPTLWVPFEDTVNAAGGITPDEGVLEPAVPGQSGPYVLHTPSMGTGRIWSGPSVETVPPGEYRISADLEVATNGTAPRGALTVLDAPLEINETTTDVAGGGQDHAFSFVAAPGPPVVLENASFERNTTGPADINWTWSEEVDWSGPGYLETEGWVLSANTTVRFFDVSILQLAES